jgi:hypothetical protein
MTHCIKCNRPLRLPSPDGYGPVCRKTAKPTPIPSVDLFGFRPEVFARELADRALIEIGREFAALTKERMEALA